MDKQTVSTGTGPQEFKQQIYSQLKKAGVVSSLKSQLRTQLLEQLRKLAGPDAVKSAAVGHDQAHSMWHTAMNSIVAEYLQSAGCQFTLSVFKSETELSEQPAFSKDDLCQLLRLDRQPQLLEHVQQLLPAQGCLALALLQALSMCGGGPTTADSACQTSTTSQMDGISRRLLQLEDHYMAKAAQKQAVMPRMALEEQMAGYRKECDDLVEAQVAARVARFREVELATARQEAAAKYRQQLELERSELERIHSDRLARLAAREEQVSEKLRRQQRDVEGVAYAQRQRILAEEERVRGMKAEVGRQLEVQEQLLHGFETQLKEREKALSAREAAAESKLAEAAELESKLAVAARKEAAATLAEEQAALRGERVALESERARVSELRQAVNADLAVARAKEDRLRTLEAARAEAEARSAAHAAGEEVLRMQLKALQEQAAALQQELVRAGAAAGAAAAAAGGTTEAVYPAGSGAGCAGAGGAPLQLPQALRELGQWQRRAQQAELMLDEVTVERDAVLGRADELALDLNAARRELAALRMQLARQQQDIVQLKLQLSHAAAAAAAAGSRGGAFSGGGAGMMRPGSSCSSQRGTAGGAAAAGMTNTVAAAGATPQMRQQQLQGSPYAAAGQYSTAHSLAAGYDTWGSPGGNIRRSLGFSSSSAPPTAAQQQQQLNVLGVGQQVQQGCWSTGGAEESQAASSRLAQLSAADANMASQLAEFRRRTAAQRAAAARQLADIKAAASSGGGAASGLRASLGCSSAVRTSLSGATGGSCGSGPYSRDEDRQHQQQQQQVMVLSGGNGSSSAGAGGSGQCRLSIPSEYEDEAEADDVLANQELLQQQQRRAALEVALQPAATRMHYQQQAANVLTASWPARGAAAAAAAGMAWPARAAAAAGAAGPSVYRLCDALARSGPPQQQQLEDQSHHQQQQQEQQQQQQLSLPWQGQGHNEGSPQQQQQGPVRQQQQQAAGEHGDVFIPPRPASSSTEFSFVQHRNDGGRESPAVDDEADGTDGSAQLQQQQQVAVQNTAGGEAAAAAEAAVSREAAAEAPAQEQMESSLCEAAGGQEEEELAAAAAGSEVSSVVQQAEQEEHSLPPAAEDTQTTSSSAAMQAAVDAADVQAVGQAEHAAAAATQAAGDDDGNDAGTAGAAAAGAAAAASGVGGFNEEEEAAAAAAAGSHDGDLHDEFAAELSAISSAVALEAAAAGLEGVRLSSSSSMGMSTSVVDRYASWEGGYEQYEGDEDEQYYHHQQQQQGQGQQQQHETEEETEEGDGHAGGEQQQPDSPGWLANMAAAGVAGDAGSAAGDAQSVADTPSLDEGEAEQAGEEGAAERWADRLAMARVQSLQSPASSEGSVF